MSTRKNSFALLFSLILFGCGDDNSSSVVENKLSVTTGTMTDTRDGQVYKIVTIGEGTDREMTWMAQNLNIEPQKSNSFCNECEKYGRMYSWAAVMDSAAEYSDDAKGRGYEDTVDVDKRVRGICPEGWHLPRPEEFDVFYSYDDSHDAVNVAAMMMSSTEWEGVDAFGMNILPAGYMYDEYYLADMKAALNSDYTHKVEWMQKGKIAFFWTSATHSSKGYAFCEYFAGKGVVYTSEDIDVWSTETCVKSDGLSVRCVKD